jgi:hypothetical protein
MSLEIISCNKFSTFKVCMCTRRNFKVFKEGCFFFLFAIDNVYSQWHGDNEEYLWRYGGVLWC